MRHLLANYRVPGASVGEMQDCLRRAASDVFRGDKAKSALWLTSLIPALGRRTPLDACTDAAGLDAALQALAPPPRRRGRR
jgi:hypothetical protein